MYKCLYLPSPSSIIVASLEMLKVVGITSEVKLVSSILVEFRFLTCHFIGRES
jgi:hypothetical protein